MHGWQPHGVLWPESGPPTSAWSWSQLLEETASTCAETRQPRWRGRARREPAGAALGWGGPSQALGGAACLARRRRRGLWPPAASEASGLRARLPPQPPAPVTSTSPAPAPIWALMESRAGPGFLGGTKSFCQRNKGCRLIGGFIYLFLGLNGKQLCLPAQRGQIGSTGLIDSSPAGTRGWREGIDSAPPAKPSLKEA